VDIEHPVSARAAPLCRMCAKPPRPPHSDAPLAQVLTPGDVSIAPPSQGGSARFKSLGPVNRAPKLIQADGVKS
jgi:hypothetical protein